jgi:hypothetical protein
MKIKETNKGNYKIIVSREELIYLYNFSVSATDKMDKRSFGEITPLPYDDELAKHIMAELGFLF